MGQVPYFNVNGEYKGSVRAEKLTACRHPRTEPYPAKDCSRGCCDGYRCLDCQETFTVEVPD